MLKNLISTTLIISLILLLSANVCGQKIAQDIHHLGQATTEPGFHHYWIHMGTNSLGLPIKIPVIVIQGISDGPTMGLTAAIHGNELNGIPLIFELKNKMNCDGLKGRIIAIPVLNPISLELNERRFIDQEDLNRIFPGKEMGNRSEQFTFQIQKNILSYFDIHIDLHTASFGRINSLYIRADQDNDTLRVISKLMEPDIILHSTGSPSAGGTGQTLRSIASQLGVKSLTLEMGNPQMFQGDLTMRCLQGILNVLDWLNMYEYNGGNSGNNQIVYCKNSYWIYMEKGGFLDVHVNLNQILEKGDSIATVRNSFGELIREYIAPQKGIVIGKSTNPVNMSGGRIIHLGILK